MPLLLPSRCRNDTGSRFSAAGRGAMARRGGRVEGRDEVYGDLARMCEVVVPQSRLLGTNTHTGTT